MKLLHASGCTILLSALLLAASCCTPPCSNLVPVARSACLCNAMSPQERAKSLPCNPVNPIPVEIVRGGPTLSTALFDLAEFNSLRPANTPELKMGDAVPTLEEEFTRLGFPASAVGGASGRSPTTMTWEQYLQELNLLESTLNSYGWSLRDTNGSPGRLGVTRAEPNRPIPVSSNTRERTIIRVKLGDNRALLPPESRAVGPDEFKNAGKDFVIGDPKFVAVEAQFRPTAVNAPNSWRAESETAVIAHLLGSPREIFRLRSESEVPISLLQQDPLRYAAGSVEVLGQTLLGSTASGETIPTKVAGTIPFPVAEPSVTFTAMLGPIPVSLTLGLSISVGPGYEASSVENVITSSTGPVVSAHLFATGMVGSSGIIGVGAKVRAEYLTLKPSLTSTGEVELDSARKLQCMKWKPALRLGMSTGEVDLFLVVTVPIPFVGPKTFTIHIVRINESSNVIVDDIPLLSGPNRVCRAQPCSGNGSQCPDGVCRDLGVDPNSCGACGNVCVGDEACVAGKCRSCMSKIRDPQRNLEIGFSCKGKIPGMECISVKEPMSPAWGDNYFCVSGNASLYSWFDHAPPTDSKLSCAHIAPRARPGWMKATGWEDNYMCSKSRGANGGGLVAAYDFSWSTKGPRAHELCVPWVEPSQQEFGADNFLCMH